MLVFLAIFGDFSGREPNLHSEISDFDFLSVSFDFLYEITLSAINIDNIGCLEPFLPLYHFENRRFLGLKCNVDLKPRLTLFFFLKMK